MYDYLLLDIVKSTTPTIDSFVMLAWASARNESARRGPH
jgi:hypothetical protein